MDINIIRKILYSKIPEDIIQEITSYFIQKISKKDSRCHCIERLLYNRSISVTEGFYSDGMFRYKLFAPEPKTINKYFLLQIIPKLFIEYTFCYENSINSIRFWIKEDKCEVAIDGYWVLHSS